MIIQRFIQVLCAGLLWLPVAVCAEPAEFIRVLLSQDLESLQVSADHQIIVRVPGQGTGRTQEPLSVSAANGVVVFKGQGTGASRVVLEPSGGDLRFSVGRGGNGTSAEVLGFGGGGIPGGLEITATGSKLMVVNVVDLETYVTGVVPSEMNAGWHGEALKAQAVAARTYVLYQKQANRGRAYDVQADTRDQVYRGRRGVDGRVLKAVADTKGLILTYDRAPIYAAFSSTAAGPTEDALNVWNKDLPYLKGVECPFDVNAPSYQWRVAFTVEVLEEKLRKAGYAIGPVATFSPFAYSRAGRVQKIRVLHAQGELILRGEDLRRVMGYSVIPSAQFDLESMDREIVLVGRGSGHAVGLCQWGTKELAEKGYPFSTILLYYFPGTEISDLRHLPGLF
jgi:stage II sporulation protein D